jgi:hypothetical protein
VCVCVWGGGGDKKYKRNLPEIVSASELPITSSTWIEKAQITLIETK